jgi:hypothetical protein
MANKRNPKTNPSETMVYQIRLEGHLGRQWAEWFGDVTLTLEENGETLLTCAVIDQAALYGLLKKVRDLGLPLVAVIRVKPGRVQASDIKL